MKANELMIGDWVVYNGDVDYTNPTKIEGMDIATGMCVTTDRDDVGFDGVWPIPLTPEILEKNGFKNGFIPALKTESSLLWVANVGEDYIEIRFDRRNIAIWYDYDENGDGVYSDCLLPLPYWLHELQHVLKLCGINKEIII